ncbi:MAG: hypothetical protein M3220_14955 [Chloroflexota bacterium]|nr:hypothetical protein [Chloroflexota bacterium]
MARLRNLTILYSVVLVLALALSLIAIWLYLDRIASVLADVREALATVGDQTEPLGKHLEQLNETAGESVEELEEALARLGRE